MVWTKPGHLAAGTVWRRFTDKETNKYVIKDVSSSAETEACIELMTSDFLPDEPICKALETTSDPLSVATIHANWRRFQQQGITLACYAVDLEDNLRDLVGVNQCLVASADDPRDDQQLVEGESWRKVLTTLEAAEATCDVFRHYGVSDVLTSSGLVVARSHRGKGVGLHMLKAREDLCRALGLDTTATVFTAVSSQKLALRCGWTTLGELPYHSMLRHGIDLSNCETPSAKYMGTRYSF